MEVGCKEVCYILAIEFHDGDGHVSLAALRVKGTGLFKDLAANARNYARPCAHTS